MSETKLTLKEGIEKLKELIFSSTKPEEIVTTEQKFTDAKLNDGTTIVRYAEDVLATGVTVNVVDEGGAEMPLPVGDYVLEDGTTFTIVDETGKADNVVLAPTAEEGVTPPSTNEGEVVAEATTPKPNPVPAAPKRVIKSQVEEHVFHLEIEGVEPIDVDFSSMFKKLEAENARLNDLNKQMFSVIEKFSELPASTATETKKKINGMDSVKSFKESMRALEIEMSKQH